MNPADAQLFVELATGLERDLAPLSQAERAQVISDYIRVADICYAVWKVGDGYRMRRLKALDGPIGETEILSGIPVVNEAHADLLMAACSHGQPMDFLQ